MTPDFGLIAEAFHRVIEDLGHIIHIVFSENLAAHGNHMDRGLLHLDDLAPWTFGMASYVYVANCQCDQCEEFDVHMANMQRQRESSAFCMCARC